MTTKLSERAMMVHLRVCRWAGDRQDPNVTSEVCEAKGAAEDAGVWVTKFIPPGKMKVLKQKAHKVKSIWIKHTRPYLDGGIRLLLSQEAETFNAEIKTAIDEYDAEAQRWVEQEYPVILAKMPDRLKKLLTDTNRTMPSPADLKLKFRIDLNIMPIPDNPAAATWQGMSEGTTAEMQAQAAKSAQRMLSSVMQDLWDELGKLIGRVEERLSDPKKKFKDSLIGNLRAFCEALPSWNLTDSPNLENARKQVLERLSSLDPQDLRENETFRKGAAKAAKGLLDSLTTARKIDLDL